MFACSPVVSSDYKLTLSFASILLTKILHVLLIGGLYTYVQDCTIMAGCIMAGQRPVLFPLVADGTWTLMSLKHNTSVPDSDWQHPSLYLTKADHTLCLSGMAGTWMWLLEQHEDPTKQEFSLLHEDLSKSFL